MPARKRFATKLRHGTARPDRARPQPMLRPGAPGAPASLDRDDRVIFERLAGAMNDQRTGTAGDLDALLLTTSALSELARHNVTLRDHGETYEHGGLIRPRPECALRDAAWKRALAGLRALGLCPSARGTVEPLIPPGPVDPLEDLLQRRDRLREAGP